MKQRRPIYRLTIDGLEIFFKQLQNKDKTGLCDCLGINFQTVYSQIRRNAFYQNDDILIVPISF